MDNKTDVLVIDGQGGKLGAQVIEKLKGAEMPITVTAVGTNGAAATAMQKAGADYIAVGENPVIVACRTADIIIGPIGIAIADSLLGEVTPKMAVAVGQSNAAKIFIPINKCNNYVVGVNNLTLSYLIEQVVTQTQRLIKGD